MKRCKGCGHHHGRGKDDWPPCGGIEELEDGGIKRCRCTGLHGAEPPAWETRTNQQTHELAA